MTTITLRIGESVNIGDGITVTIVDTIRDRARVGIDAPRDVMIERVPERIATYADAVLAGFGYSEDAIARAEAEAEVRDIERSLGRDPHTCTRCGKVDCVCTVEIPVAAIHAARSATVEG